MLEKINNLVTKEGFTFFSWDDVYSKGVWACVAPNFSYADEIERVSSAGDLDMFPATEYLLSVDWLPLVIGDDFKNEFD